MDKYLHYDHLELSEDPSFIKWVKGSSSEDPQDWDAWVARHPDKHQLVEDAKRIVLSMKFDLDNPPKESEDKVWARIQETTQKKTSSEKPKLARRRLLLFIPYAAAAALVLAFIINLGGAYDTSISTPYASVEKIILPDGSEVQLNADSKLEYDKASWNENRLVALEGEAFFEVVKGSSFKVKTSNGSVQVLGTSFNVYNRDQNFKVHCETGKVSVKSSDKETIITPGQSVEVIKKKHLYNKNVSATENRSKWRNGVYSFEASKLSDVIEELERQLDIKITIDKSLTTQKYTGSFNNSSVETALTEVFYPLGLTYDIKGRNISVSK